MVRPVYKKPLTGPCSGSSSHALTKQSLSTGIMFILQYVNAQLTLSTARLIRFHHLLYNGYEVTHQPETMLVPGQMRLAHKFQGGTGSGTVLTDAKVLPFLGRYFRANHVGQSYWALQLCPSIIGQRHCVRRVQYSKRHFVIILHSTILQLRSDSSLSRLPRTYSEGHPG
ncbi:hypothetical protein P153DRAFT_46808 [Dothidotthia symphoricarpi CBS 119687]|uniref:Uncharacterized protein n=1 Tax=Dothidotthia symphoricarpi CBS 119687 TaxID=1392245 RepID=A0A6A6AA35_9PLEO|nr:uncharacterized protein P153DRAFT_46808 [Dothidotthia symphoricarpi CBS 119687]KAF2128025.1 hypothetical protein P153DRAFT_46808 [Dothidotthia symphoricarpi CBS 119687]